MNLKSFPPFSALCLRAFACASIATFLIGCATPSREAATAPTQLPEAVASFGATSTDDGSIYVYGGYRGERHGYNRDDVSGTLWRWRPDGGAWESLPTAGLSQGTALVSDGRTLYRVGGMAARNAKGEKQDLASQTVAARFNGARWEALPALPEARSSHDAVCLDGRLYVAGGWTLPGGTNRGVWLDHMLVLDPRNPGAQWEKIPQPFKRRALAMAALDGRIYCVGGMDDDDTTCRDVDIYDTQTGQWSKGPELPKAPMNGFGCAAIAANGRLYVSGFSGQLVRLNPDASGWEPVTKLEQPRFFHRFVSLAENRLLALGGESKEGKLDGCEIVELQPQRLKFARRTDRPGFHRFANPVVPR
jgi:N-acetylneuraminic acid mutarotase